MARNNTRDLSSYLRRGIDISRVLGTGSYGTIHEVTLNRVRCIAKRIHDILQPQDDFDEGDENIVSIRFRQECELINTLRHPNIVQCLGTHKLDIGNGRLEEMLVMEYMHMDLGQCLQTYPNICDPMKFSILCDISHGLLHLHSQDPPIIHRDLTASNILLTTDMRAKIADLGVSKIFDLRDIQSHALTQAPGTLAYMPPEALTEEPEYDTKLDIFSFGAVTLYTGTQEFPTVYEVQITPEVLEKKELQLHKRKRWTDKLGSVHPLYPLVSKCLQDDPSVRPSADEVCSDIEKLCNKNPWNFKDIMKSDIVDLTKEALAEENKRLLSDMSVMKARHDEALSCVQQKDKEIEDVLMDYTALQKTLDDLQQQFKCKLNEMEQETKRIQKKKEEHRMEYKQVQREKEEAKQEYKLLQKEMEHLRHECKQIQEHHMTVHAAETLELKKEIAAKEKLSFELKDEVQTLQSKVVDLMNGNSSLQSQIAAKEKQALELNNENRTLQQKVIQFQETNTLLQIEQVKQSHKYSTEISTLQSTVKELQVANSVLQNQVAANEEHSFELKDEVQTLQSKVVDLMNDNTSLQNQIAAEKKQALELNNENRTSQQKVKQFQETITLLQNEQMTQSHKHSTEISTLQLTVNELQHANSVLQIQADCFERDFSQERRDRELLASRLSVYEEQERVREQQSKKKKWF